MKPSTSLQRLVRTFALLLSFTTAAAVAQAQTTAEIVKKGKVTIGVCRARRRSA